MDLRKDVRIDWITVELAKERHHRMSVLFDTFGFSNTNQINGRLVDKSNKTFIEIQKLKSHAVAETHEQALGQKGEVLILEDDVWFTEAMVPIINNIPSDADAVYLGTSVYGMVNGISTPNGNEYKKIDDNWDKPLNMLGIHAVLYLTESYKQKAIENLLGAKDNGMYCDEPIAIDMKNHNVYSCVVPMLYQNDGHNNNVTRIPLRQMQIPVRGGQ